MLALKDPEGFGPEWVLERPKVYLAAGSGRFVMYFHRDGRITPDHPSRYSVARVGVAPCYTVHGVYEYQRSFQPLGKESRDIG